MKAKPMHRVENQEPVTGPGIDVFFDQQVDELGVLHKESNEWLQQISFMKDEILFLQNLLTSVLHLSLSGAENDHLTEELSLLNDQHISLAHHQIIEHERWLSDIIRTDTVGRQINYREIHWELSGKMKVYYPSFLQLRHHILLLASNYLQTKVKI